MFSSIKLRLSNPPHTTNSPSSLPHTTTTKNLNLKLFKLHTPTSSSDLHLSNNPLRFSSLSIQSDGKPSLLTSSVGPLRFSSLSIQSDGKPSLLTSSVGSPPLVSTQWNLTQRHILMLNVIACAVAVSASWLFLSAIPALLSFRRAADSLANLMDVMREELPDTMAAVRLSGMEISDLTMELSDLGQEITKGVRSSTQAVRVAEDRLRRLATMAPKAMVQEQPYLKKTDIMEPSVAKAARGLREGIVNGRAFLQMFFSLTRFSRFAMNFLSARRKNP